MAVAAADMSIVVRYDEAEETINQFEHTGFTFLTTDLDTALTLCKIALNGGEDFEKRVRNRKNARHAYDTVLQLAEKLSVTEEESREQNAKASGTLVCLTSSINFAFFVYVRNICVEQQKSSVANDWLHEKIWIGS